MLCFSCTPEFSKTLIKNLFNPLLMPSLKVHCAISRERTGNTYKNLHEWIDSPQKHMGVNHRTERHSFNLKERNYILKRWDDKAVVEWLFHIAIDNLETAFKEAKKAYRGNNAYNFFKFGMVPDSKFIMFDFDRLDEDELDNEFEDVYE